MKTKTRKLINSITWNKETHYIGETIPLYNIPNDEKHSILRSNIEFNSTTKTAIKCHLGNWQYPRDENDKVLSKDLFEFENRWV